MLKKHGKLRIYAIVVTVLLFQASLNQAADFEQCVDNLAQNAKDEGIPKDIITEALSPVEYIPRTIDLDQKQPEFNETFANYLHKRVTDYRIEQGRVLLQENKKLLSKLTEEYGIPQQYLIAFWGLETNYGSYLGKFPVVDTLVTLACDERRSEYFSKEVISALQLMQKHNISREDMLGSWAGAMGHTQFMPSAYLKYGVDGENNNTVNLWKSIPDAMTSAANFLNGLGWQEDSSWGREILLPKDFDYQNTGLKKQKTITQWRNLGVTTISGKLLLPNEKKAALIVPAGYRGPAFLIYENFNVIMGWNRSIYYALSVGLLANRINGSEELQRRPPLDAPRLNVTKIKALQVKLNQLGFKSGEPDGIIGSATRNAIRNYQRSREMIADGYPRTKVFTALNIKTKQ